MYREVRNFTDLFLAGTENVIVENDSIESEIPEAPQADEGTGEADEKKKKKKNKNKNKGSSKVQTTPPTIPIAELFPNG